MLLASCQAHVFNQGDLLVRHHFAENLAENKPPPTAPWRTLLVLASERVQFYAPLQAIGVTAETAGAETARLYGNIAYELTLEGTHLAVVQQCASAEDVHFMDMLHSFLEEPSSNTAYVGRDGPRLTIQGGAP